MCRLITFDFWAGRQESVTTVNGARVLTPDLQIGVNLLVHVIDRVLLVDQSPSRTILDILNDGGRFQSALGVDNQRRTFR